MRKLTAWQVPDITYPDISDWETAYSNRRAVPDVSDWLSTASAASAKFAEEFDGHKNLGISVRKWLSTHHRRL
jgi:hypothetical protein